LISYAEHSPSPRPALSWTVELSLVTPRRRPLAGLLKCRSPSRTCWQRILPRAACQRPPTSCSSPRLEGRFDGRHSVTAASAAGLDGLAFHGLRHSAVGLMIEVGVEVIKQRLGHSSIRVTSDVYGSVLPHVDACVTAALGDLFSKSRGLNADLSRQASASAQRCRRPRPACVRVEVRGLEPLTSTLRT
jgi:hypothetical protein